MQRVMLVLALAGCSFSVQGPRTRDASVPPVCTRNADGRLLADGVGGTVLGLAAIGGLALLASTEGDEESGELPGFGALLAIGGGLWATLHWTALFTGRSDARACREAHRRHDAWAVGQR
jgi:hypothetical protein